MAKHKPKLGQNFLRNERTARRIVEESRVTNHDLVLELGAGTGLVSLVCARFLAALGPTADAKDSKTTVTATDYHQIVLKNLDHNIQANFPTGTPPHVSFSAHALDWSRYSTEGGCSVAFSESPFDRPFDVILGADVIYEPQHAIWIRDCVSALLRRPTTTHGVDPAPLPRFHLVMPLRPTHAYESRAVEEVFPLVEQGHVTEGKIIPEPRLRILEKKTMLCEVEDSRPRADVEYVYYVIGWA